MTPDRPAPTDESATGEFSKMIDEQLELAAAKLPA